MSTRDYFPLGKAHGKAFCNRSKETEWLVDNINSCKHSLLIAPRRFGKSSLSDKACKKAGYPFITLNFNTCSDERDIDILIRRGVSKLIGEAIGKIDKIATLIKRYVTHLTPKISIGEHLSLELAALDEENAAINITEALQLLEKLLANKKQRAIIIMDEFQTVGEIAKGKGIEAAIRNVIQDNQYLVVLFSGSNRNLLKTMFEDDARPLYKLCRKLHLEKIDKEHYRKHINIIAKDTWGAVLTELVFTMIMKLSERHPYYVNYLCDVIWTESDKLPTEKMVLKAWNTLLEEENSDANKEISQLALGQRKILTYIANNNGTSLLSKEIANTLSMPTSSISVAINKLLEKDIIEKHEQCYDIINPVLKDTLLNPMV